MLPRELCAPADDLYCLFGPTGIRPPYELFRFFLRRLAHRSDFVRRSRFHYRLTIGDRFPVLGIY